MNYDVEVNGIRIALSHCSLPDTLEQATHLSQLGKNANRRRERGRVVESQINIEAGDLVNLVLVEIEGAAVQVLLQAVHVVRLGNNNNVSLGAPAQQDLARGLAVLLGDALDHVGLEERLGALGLFVVHLEEAERAKGGVARDLDVVVLRQLDQVGLGEVRVVLNLQHGWGNLGVGQQIVDELGAEVGDTN